MKISFPKKLKSYLKTAISSFLVVGYTMFSVPTILHAQSYTYQQNMPRRQMQYTQNYQNMKEDVHIARAVYYINNILKDVAEDIENNRKWHDKFFYINDYTDFDFNNFLNIYMPLLEMENNIIEDKLQLFNYDTELQYKDEDIKEAENIKQEIENLLNSSPRNYQNFINLVSKYEALMEIKNRYEDYTYSTTAPLLPRIFLGHYRSQDPRIGDISYYPLIRVDKAVLSKLQNWKIDLKNEVSANPGAFLKFFGKSVKNAESEVKTYEEVIPGPSY